MQPSVAIVILNFNGRNYLQKFLPSILASTYANKKIIIADNASTDDSVQLVKQDFPTVELLLNTNNDGFAAGYNWALQKIQADYYVLLNSDVEVSLNWLEPIITLMEANKTIGACQPKILSYHNKTMFEYAGAAGGWIDSLGYPFSRGRVFDSCEKDEGQYNNTQEIFWATGASMFVRSQVFHQLGGLDDYFFAHQEEIDLCWRMQLAGYKIFAVPASVVYHVGGGTLPVGFQKNYLNFRNNLIMLSKNLCLTEKWWKIPTRIALNKIGALQALLKGDTEMFRAIFKAHLHYIKWLWSKKQKNQLTKKPLSNLSGVYKDSVVWQYFVKKKKKFSELVNR